MRSQLLHLSARTRCRWSLRFQVSYLTLLFRRTNRSGPVDFLPGIFAEVTALRHKVMPRGDRFDAAFVTDRQRDTLTVRAKSHRSGVISKGRMRFELMPLIRVTRVYGADFGNRVDHVLRGQRGFLTDEAIALVMDVVSAMQIPLEGEFGKSVTGAIELFDSRFEFLAGASGQDQFRLDRQVNAHRHNMP